MAGKGASTHPPWGVRFHRDRRSQNGDGPRVPGRGWSNACRQRWRFPLRQELSHFLPRRQCCGQRGHGHLPLVPPRQRFRRQGPRHGRAGIDTLPRGKIAFGNPRSSVPHRARGVGMPAGNRHDQARAGHRTAEPSLHSAARRVREGVSGGAARPVSGADHISAAGREGAARGDPAGAAQLPRDRLRRQEDGRRVEFPDGGGSARRRGRGRGGWGLRLR
mmetsp:Transcript_50244/g.119488  ORF Transcript_50244/g.119488 Transcript_50244/m.119488 type:complete len:219 (-) Transcript_50244:104-760(-)